MTKYDKYVNDVLTGEIVEGNLIKLACQRYINDLNRDDLIFRTEKVKFAISFIASLKHFTGKHSGKHFILEPWQEFIVANIVGFYYKETNTRKYSSSYIEVARKNGKSALASALCLYFLIADGEDGAEVLLAANSRDQAKIAFDMCSHFCDGLDPSNHYLHKLRSSIDFKTNKSSLRVLAADDSKLDGFNASFGLIDEFHAAANTKVRDVIKSSMGMRSNPHLCTITTAGFDKASPCYGVREVCIDILNDIKQDDSMFIAIYAMDNEDDWQDENNWSKCNPNLGITVQTKYLREQVQQAKNNPTDEVGVRTKNLNQWCDSANVWIAEDYIVNSIDMVDLSTFTGETCYVGVDLGATSDLTAVSYLIVKNDKYYFKTQYYLPEAALTEKVDKEQYKLWRRLSYLTVTPGNVTDYDYITKDIMEWNKTLRIRKIGYDSYNATQWAIDCTALGLPLEPYSQTLGSFNRPTKELERLIMSGKVVIDNNDATRVCFRNVVIKYDHNGNAKPAKTVDKKKIDGVIAMLQCLGTYLATPQYTYTI